MTTTGLWIAVACSACIYLGLKLGKFLAWADTKVPVVGTLEPYRNWEPEHEDSEQLYVPREWVA